jgi:hypothetical protein
MSVVLEVADGEDARESSSDILMAPLVERYGQYTTDYDKYTSVKRIKTLRNSVVSNTAV